MSDQGGGGGDSSSTERSSHTSSTVLLSDAVRRHSGVLSDAGRHYGRSGTASQGSTWRTTPLLDALARPAQLGSPSLAARRLTRWKRIASDDMEKSMMEEKEDTASSSQEAPRQSTVEDDDADTEETPGGSGEALEPVVAGKEKGSGVPPLSDSEDDSTHVLMPLHETCR